MSTLEHPRTKRQRETTRLDACRHLFASHKLRAILTDLPSWSRLEIAAVILLEDLHRFDDEPIIRGDATSEKRLVAMAQVLRSTALLRQRFAEAPHTGNVDGVSLHYALTERQSGVLRHLLLGLSEKEIAKRLTISRHTIHEHVKAIYKVLLVRSRSELMSRFLHDELPPVDDVHGASLADSV